MITHEPGASSPNFVAEILMGLEELQAKVAESGSLRSLITTPHEYALIIMSEGEIYVRGYDGNHGTAFSSRETLLAGISEGTLSLPVAYREFRLGKTGLDAVEELRGYWADILSGKHHHHAAVILSWGYMPATTEFESFGLTPLRLLDSIYQVFQYEHMSLRVMARRDKGYLDMLEKAFTEVCRPLFSDDVSELVLSDFDSNLTLESVIESRGLTELVDMLATERQLSPEMQTARRHLARIEVTVTWPSF
jgi:hypothetical protein